LMSEHTSFSECKYPQIYDIFLSTNYFGDETVICSCIRKNCVYSREWDYEYNEHYSRTIGGIFTALGMFENTIRDPQNSSLPDEIKQKIESMADSEKSTIYKLIEEFPLKRISNSLSRISIRVKRDSETIYLGFIDLSPFGISEVYIAPPLWMKPPHYYLTCERMYFPDTTLRVKENNAELVNCVPFIKVQGEVAVCAQYAVRMALMILSQKPPTVPEIVFEANKSALKGGLDRDQADGWYPDEIRQAIEDKGYGVHELSRLDICPCGNVLSTIRCDVCGVEYTLNSQLKSPNLENIYAYVESGTPVILGIKNTKWLPWWPNDDGEAHAIVAIGHTISEDNRIDGLIVHDESMYPYQVLPEELENGVAIEEIVDSVIIPVPREVTVEYPVAKGIFEEIVGKLQEYSILNDIVYRPLLVDAHHVKRMLGEVVQRAGIMDCNIPEKVRNDFLYAYMDRYVWMFELRYDTDAEHYQYAGDILIGTKFPAILGANVPEAESYAFKENEFDDGLTFSNYSDE